MRNINLLIGSLYTFQFISECKANWLCRPVTVTWRVKEKQVLQRMSSLRTSLSFEASSPHSTSEPRILFSLRRAAFFVFLCTSILLLLSPRQPLPGFPQFPQNLRMDDEVQCPERVAQVSSC
jgi:hypothetical protein